MSTLNIHTHYQATPALVQTKAWQRVCLCQRSIKTTYNPADEKQARLPNSVYVIIEGEVVNRRDELLRNFVLNGQENASNPLLHIHAKL